MFFEAFGFFLAVMGAIGLCIVVAGAFINIEKLIVPKDENLDLEEMVCLYIALVMLVYFSMAMIIAGMNMQEKSEGE